MSLQGCVCSVLVSVASVVKFTCAALKRGGGRRCVRPSVGFLRPLSHLSATWQLTDSSACSSRDPAGECLRPRGGHVVSGRHPVHPVSPLSLLLPTLTSTHTQINHCLSPIRAHFTSKFHSLSTSIRAVDTV